MLMRVAQPLDLDSTLFSGQAFRWRRDGGWFHGVVFGNVVKMRPAADGVEFSCAPDSERAMEPLLRDYLGLGADLDQIYAAIANDDRLRSAVRRYRGMRILRQEPWECLVSFICSSYSNIPRITRNVEDLCASLGRPVGTGDHARSIFPNPQELAEAGEQHLRGLGLGYRAKSLAATSRAIADGALDLITLREATYEDALEALMALPGVGDKVANCVLLFSLDKLEAFPVDVWVRRAVQEWYFDGRIPGKGTPMSQRDGSMPGKGTTVPQKDDGMPSKGSTVPQKDGSMPGKGSTVPQKDGRMPGKGSTVPQEDGSMPGKGTAVSQKRGATISQKKVRLWAQDHFGPYAGYANQYLFHDRRLQGKGR